MTRLSSQTAGAGDLCSPRKRVPLRDGSILRREKSFRRVSLTFRGERVHVMDGVLRCPREFAKVASKIYTTACRVFS